MNRLEDVGIEKLFENLAQITVSPRTLQNITDVNLNNLGISSKKQKVDSGYFSSLQDEVEGNYEDSDHISVVEIQQNIKEHSGLETCHHHKSDSRCTKKPENNKALLNDEISSQYQYDAKQSTSARNDKTFLKSILKKPMQFVMKVFRPKESNYTRRLRAIKQRRESKNLSISVFNQSHHVYYVP